MNDDGRRGRMVGTQLSMMMKLFIKLNFIIESIFFIKKLNYLIFIIFDLSCKTFNKNSNFELNARYSANIISKFN